jgi:formylglycine-generating enzyme required for sulfatase activity
MRASGPMRLATPMVQLLTILAGCAARRPAEPVAAQSTAVRRHEPVAPLEDASVVASDCPAPQACFSAGLSLLGREGSDSRFEERPLRVARLRAFAIDRDEVREGAYDRCVRAGRCGPLAACASAARPLGDAGSDAPSGAPSVDASRPVRCARWEDARAHCAFVGGRLPTEAEWERAAAGALPEHRVFPWGDTPDRGAEDRTPESVRAMGGGVAEWVEDVGAFYQVAAPGPARDAGPPDAAVDDGGSDQAERELTAASADGVDAGPVDAGPVVVDDPRGPRNGPWRVVRGGHDGAPIGRWRASARTFRRPDDAAHWLGFRCAYDR